MQQLHIPRRFFLLHKLYTQMYSNHLQNKHNVLMWYILR